MDTEFLTSPNQSSAYSEANQPASGLAPTEHAEQPFEGSDSFNFNGCFYNLDIEQGSSEWKRLRAGFFTGSAFGSFTWQKKRDGEVYATSKAGAKSLAQKVKWAIPYDLKGMSNMTVGTVLEPYLRDVYSKLNPWVNVLEVGFIQSQTHPLAGYSPDGVLLNEEGVPCGLLEIKNVTFPTFLSALETGEPEEKYKAQVLYGLFVTGLPYADLIYGCPQMPAEKCFWVKRYYQKDVDDSVREKYEYLLSEVEALNTLVNNYRFTLPEHSEPVDSEFVLKLAQDYKKGGILCDPIAHYVTDRSNLSQDLQDFNSIDDYLERKDDEEDRGKLFLTIAENESIYQDYKQHLQEQDQAIAKQQQQNIDALVQYQLSLNKGV